MPARSVDHWLESIKHGYGDRYVSFFDELGIEDEEDVRRMKDERVEELRQMLDRSGIKVVQMDYLTDAIDEARGAARDGKTPASSERLEFGEGRDGDRGDGDRFRGRVRPGARPGSAKGERATPSRRPPRSDAPRPRSASSGALRGSGRARSRRSPEERVAWQNSHMPNYEVADRSLVSSTGSGFGGPRPTSAPASRPSAARSLVLPQPPAAKTYWATPAPADLPVTMVSPKRGGTGSPKARDAAGYESLKRKERTEAEGRRRRDLHAVTSWEEQEANAVMEAPSGKCRVSRDASGLWRLDIEPARQLVYKRISTPVRINGDHLASLKMMKDHDAEMKRTFSHRVKVARNQDGLWALDLKNPRDKHVDEDRAETWRRVTQPFRLKGTHVQSISEHKAEDEQIAKEKKHFYWDSKDSKEWCDRMSRPLRAAEKFKGWAPGGTGAPDSPVFKP